MIQGQGRGREPGGLRMLRIGIAGCGRAARIHLGRILASQGVKVVGLSDIEPETARALADTVPSQEGPVPAFSDHKEMLARVAPDAIAIFAPHRAHYRLAMDAPPGRLSCVRGEAAHDQHAGGGRYRGPGQGPEPDRGRGASISAAAEPDRGAIRLLSGAIGKVHLIAAALSAPWLARHQEKADAWRLDPKLSGGGILADAGDHMMDALLWTTGQTAVEVAAFQDRLAPGLDVVTAATVRLSQGAMATIAISGVCTESVFAFTFFGEHGRMTATDTSLRLVSGGTPESTLSLPEPAATIDGDFIAAVTAGGAPCCPADEAMGTVRLLEAIARSATSGQFVRLA